MEMINLYLADGGAKRDLRNGEECKENLTIAEDKTIRKVGDPQYVMRASTLAYSS